MHLKVNNQYLDPDLHVLLSSMFASLYKQLLGNKINVYAWSKALAENCELHHNGVQ